MEDIRKNIKNLRVFKIKYFGATNTKGSRIKIIDCRFNKSKMVHRSYKYINGKDDAIEYLKGLNIPVLFCGELSDSEDVLLSDDFEIQIN